MKLSVTDFILFGLNLKAIKAGQVVEDDLQVLNEILSCY